MAREDLLDLRALVKIQFIEELSRVFFKATHLAISFLDKDGKYISEPKGKAPFCLHIGDMNLHPICYKTDLDNWNIAKESGRTVIYYCPWGLANAVVPLKINEKIIGGAVTGQVRTEKSKLSYPKGIEIPEEDKYILGQPFPELPFYTEKQFIELVNLIEILFQYIIEREYANLLKLIQAEPRKSIRISRVKEYIEENYWRKLTMDELARIAHTSPFYLSHIFKETEGLTLGKYIEKIRIEKAKELLAKTNLSITEISTRVGFSDSNYFSARFKKVVGISPRAYRNNSREEKMDPSVLHDEFEQV